jgi:TPR repeat protein
MPEDATKLLDKAVKQGKARGVRRQPRLTLGDATKLLHKAVKQGNAHGVRR